MIKPLAAILITVALVTLLFRAARAFDWATRQGRYVDWREWVWRVLA